LPAKFRFTSLWARVFLLIVLAMGVALGSTLWAANTFGIVLNVLAGGTAVAILLAAFVSRRITGPLDRMTATLAAAAGSGQIPADFPEDSSLRQLNSLARALNHASRSIQTSRTDLDSAYFQFVETMAQALDARDPYTAGHSIRVADYSYAIAQEMGLPSGQAETIRIAAQLHDIGKIGIPDAILQKTSPLTNEEFGLIKLHPQIGRKILEKVSRFEDLLGVVELHHENYDGTGYPYKLSQQRIPLSARIVKVADAFDSMMSDRSYRDAMPMSKAVHELVSHSGSQFDPEVIAAFLKLLARGTSEIMLGVSLSAANGAPKAVRHEWTAA
jgi:HD-GYP domain-containing protein (c-di-GMP phosphodiesterase class II)